MYVSQNLHGAWTVEMARPCLDVGQAQERVRCIAIGCGVRRRAAMAEGQANQGEGQGAHRRPPS